MDLKNYRRQIDEIDNELLRLFKERMDVSRQIASYKKEHDLPALDMTREREKLSDIKEKAGAEMGPYARILYMTLFSLSRLYQEDLLRDEPKPE